MDTFFSVIHKKTDCIACFQSVKFSGEHSHVLLSVTPRDLQGQVGSSLIWENEEKEYFGFNGDLYVAD